MAWGDETAHCGNQRLLTQQRTMRLAHRQKTDVAPFCALLVAAVTFRFLHHNAAVLTPAALVASQVVLFHFLFPY